MLIDESTSENHLTHIMGSEMFHELKPILFFKSFLNSFSEVLCEINFVGVERHF